MSAPALVYMTTDVKIIDWWEKYKAANEVRRIAIKAFLDKINAEWGGPARTNVYILDGRVVGLPEESEIPANWRLSDSGYYMTPKLNSKAGKAWKAEMDAIPVLSLLTAADAIGVPSLSIPEDTHRIYTPGIEYDEDEDGTLVALYQLWSSADTKPEVESAIKARGVQWEEMPLSAWYGRKERKEAEQHTN